MNATTRLRQLFNRSLRRHGFLVVPLMFAVACPAFAPCARARCEQGCDTTHNNTFLGNDALRANTTGTLNTATGGYALAGNTTGVNNTASGFGALFSNTTGADNTASGVSAVFSNTTGYDNAASGFDALFSNTTGYNNTAVGYQSMNKNTSGPGDTAIGYQALYSNTTAGNNTATGSQSLYNSTGIGNTGDGEGSLYSNTTGEQNTALGNSALYENTTGSNNIAVGRGAGFFLTTGSNNIDIGNRGVAGEAGIIRVGTSGTQTASFIAGIRGVAVAGGQPVGVNANGQLGVRASSARFKEAIKPMDMASEAILALQPVTFRYKKELDPKGAAQFGLVAEEVAKVAPDLVTMDDHGKPLTVRYDEVNAMLLNEFLKEHRVFLEEPGKVREQGRTIQEQERKLRDQERVIAQLKEEVETVVAHPKGQDSKLQKVSDQIELSKAVPVTATHDP